ncbi:UNVERIFIED_CONTAM: hypothetical protein FKN15_016729 [Acipenser sinensis]
MGSNRNWFHGFEGLNCEINFDECSYGFCQNNSTCIDLVADYNCVCTPGFNGLSGQFCEVNIDECQQGPCGALSICKDSVNTFQCFCAPGFIGNNCEIEVDECLSDPCQNGATCFDELDAFSCLCPDGTEGNNCEIEVDECLSDPCQNGATCFDELDAFSCLCPDGTEGNYCEININECHSSPCFHNATCVDFINGYECICLPGFTGVECEIDIDECVSSPCMNGATCIDQPGNYFCQCVAPFKGSNCEFRPCEASNPCENGAVCVEEMELDTFPLGFRCQCAKGFAGPRCEINVNECISNPCINGYCYDVAHQTRRGKRADLLTAERLSYKDWPTNKPLKALFDRDKSIPAGSDRSFMFLQLCEAMSAEPIFPPPPAARPRAQRPKAAASALSSQAPQMPPISIPASTPATHEDIKGYLQPLAVSDIRLDVIEGRPAAAAIPLPPRSLPQPDLEATPHFNLASASTSSQPSTAIRHYTVSPQIRRQIIKDAYVLLVGEELTVPRM